MTGIERLRAISGAWDEWGLGGTLTEIADQIERELARHDEPDSTDNGAHLLYVTDEDRKALEWVRGYGGIGCVQTMVASLRDTLNWIRERVGIGEDEIVDYDELLDALDRRLMPEGCEWPRFEDGEPVRIGDVVSDVEVRSVVFRDGGILLSDCTSVPGWGTWRSYKEPIKRPAVPASDGEPLEVGQTVWDTKGNGPYIIDAIEGDGVVRIKGNDLDYLGADFTHQRPVLDADGVPIKNGDTVWKVGTVLAIPMTVVEVSRDTVRCEYAWTDGKVYRPCCSPDTLTHTKPEPTDNLERIADEIDRLREEVALHLGDYLYDEDGNDSIQFSMELVAKRCRALAERERGE